MEVLGLSGEVATGWRHGRGVDGAMGGLGGDAGVG